MTFVRIPQPGEVLVGKYKLRDLIGEGGFARVLRALDMRVEREVAVKFLLPSADGTYPTSLAARFVREAKLLASLHDPHTLQLFDFGQTEDGAYFMVSELLTGTDLSEVLRERGRLSPEETTHVVLQLVHSLREAHAVGILHRDVKPSNIRIYDYDNDPLRVKLMDFGVARSIDDATSGSITSTGAHVGTLMYMSPEQLHGEPLTPASDLFAVGLTAFEMLHGECKTARQAVFAARAVPVEGPEPLRSLIGRLLELRAEDRLQSAQQIIDVLSPYDSKPGRALPADYGASLTPRSQPNPAYPAYATPHPHTRDRSRSISTVIEPAPRFAVPLWAMVATAFVVGVLLIAGVGRLLVNKPAAEPVILPPQRTANPLGVAKSPVVVTASPTADASNPVEDSDAGAAAEPRGSFNDGGCAVASDDAGRRVLRRFDPGMGAQPYDLYVPPKQKLGKELPLLVVFHTDSEDATTFFSVGKFAKLAKEEGFIVALPHGAGFISWENGFSAERAKKLVNDVGDVACIDPDRIYLLGHGAGGVPAVELGCEPWVSAVITTSYRPDVDAQICRSRPVPYLAFSPKMSRHVPLAGGSNCTQTRRVASAAYERDWWTERNHCAGEAELARTPNLQCRSWKGCDAPLTICDVEGGHNWPGVSPRAIDLLGCDGPAVSADFHGVIADFVRALPTK